MQLNAQLLASQQQHHVYVRTNSNDSSYTSNSPNESGFKVCQLNNIWTLKSFDHFKISKKDFFRNFKYVFWMSELMDLRKFCPLKTKRKIKCFFATYWRQYLLKQHYFWLRETRDFLKFISKVLKQYSCIFLPSSLFSLNMVYLLDLQWIRGINPFYATGSFPYPLKI